MIKTQIKYQNVRSIKVNTETVNHSKTRSFKYCIYEMETQGDGPAIHHSRAAMKVHARLIHFGQVTQK